MRVVIIGGSGLIGSAVAELLSEAGHEIVVASRRKGIDAVTGEGLAEAMTGADVVVDVSNSPSFEEEAVLNFFTRSSSNATRSAKDAGVKLYVALSIVGIDRLPQNAYFRAKLAQEEIIQNSGLPYTIVRATQFHEFVDAIVYTSTIGNVVRVSTAYIQPIASEDVARFVAAASTEEPANGIVEVAGPERFRTDELVESYLSSKADSSTVVGDPEAEYFGARLQPTSLVPLDDYKPGLVTFETWAKKSAA
ncbi:SDR family oxidoreductase [Pararhizobium arenae]|uniref:SDR family oxidoreductase n=1 Tax=Pararhizobium arenae TaxID=1856850 RepID=UPI00094B5A2D|nr:SDR family oxidoreductase [Pararhizobium arenae]